jgi:hypothetical protein
MKKQTVKKKASEGKTGLELIGVKIGNRTPATYRGLGGTFASFKDSCLRKQTLPGFHETGLIAGTEPKEEGIVLYLSGKHSEAKLREVIDIALLNSGAYPDKRGKARFIIDVKSDK